VSWAGAELRSAAGYAFGLRRYLDTPVSAAECRRQVAAGLARRETAFLETLERRVLQVPGSPYRALLEHAGVELGDAAQLVREHGLEGALFRLHEAGVYVTLEEFKGRRPIVRPGLELPVTPEQFDNPAPGPAFHGRTGGSRSPGRRLLVDLAHLGYEASYHALFDEAHDPGWRPLALWRPAPPGYAGMYYALSFAKLGRRIERWFSQNPLAARPGELREYLIASFTARASRTTRIPIPRPEHVPVAEAFRVAEWLAERAREGTPGRLNTTASCGVRVASAALEAALDIEGSLLVLGGEPLTGAKARAIAAAGVKAVCGYYMTEIGRIGITCGAPAALDDVHLADDKLALVQRARPVSADGATVGAFLLTTLLPSSPKVMLNVESDDFGVLEERACGCPIGEAGLTRHVHSIRSFEKLASEGMSFLGGDLVTLVEDVLPARFGGSPVDYQLVEHEVGGLTRVSVVVSPRVGPLDEAEVVAAALVHLARGPAYRRMMTEVWRDSGTLRVERREPYVTGSAKVLPLHVLEETRRDES
jgi:hypothetical protein